jgi:2,4-dienoyl-CoA reductase (NADPH2)
MYDTILSPIDYGGMQLKNRIIFAPTTFGLSDEEYLAEMERLGHDHHRRRAGGQEPV